ncbi:MAG: VWA domain-containing protein [Planctomycetes bacterium]|nr:VWA domain-containing protein [Planctomycetota bacterium]
MHAVLLAATFVLFQVDLGLPHQPDLDLPVRPENYDPTLRPPAPSPPPTEHEDPRDEPPPVFYGEEIPTESASLVYVLDFSGSMSYGGRVDTAKAEFRRSVNELPPTFRLNVVIYDCSIVSWADRSRPATPDAKADAIRWVESIHPNGGGTATGPAVALGLAEKENLAVALLTDGDPNCGAGGHEGHRAMIRQANSQGAVITVFGIDAWGEYRVFCQNVAADSGGTYFDVPSGPPPAPAPPANAAAAKAGGAADKTGM